MKLKFKVQPYQTQAVELVLAVFKGQPNQTALQYRIDPGSDTSHGLPKRKNIYFRMAKSKLI